MCAGVALNLAGIDTLPTMIVVLMIGFGFLGRVIPSTSLMALEHHGEIFIALMGLFVDGTARPMLAPSVSAFGVRS